VIGLPRDDHGDQRARVDERHRRLRRCFSSTTSAKARTGVTRQVIAVPLDRADRVGEPLDRIGGEHPPGPLACRPSQDLETDCAVS
jgi:hypothetical protein